jgi:Tol biopolymer transport system component
MLVTSQSSAKPSTLPFSALVAAPAPQAADVSRVAISPLVSNLENIQTLIVEPQTDTVKVTPISEVGEGLWLPRWSPDSTKLALTSIGGRIVASTVDGTTRYDLGPGDSPAWSPDNNRIAYAGTSAGDEFTLRDIHVVDWQGRGPRFRLTDAGEQEFYTSPSWSPDSTRIAFLEIDSGQLFVGVVQQN